ncbi:MAG TPA: ABC transporter permease [Candidatus Woesebacteria bacterium]|nr:ABC transporter permease [Candidatus Woesebacteria bacterium]
MNKTNASFTVGRFLAIRDLKRSNPWTTLLIIFVMSLTFLNMVLIGGLLLGLAQGMIGSFKQYYSADLFITPSTEKSIIEQTQDITSAVETIPNLDSYTLRITTPAKVEYGHRTRTEPTDIVENSQAVLTGINFSQENEVTDLSKKVIEGEYLSDIDFNSVLVGKNLFEKYSNRPDSSTEQKLKNAEVGSVVNVVVGNTQKEFIIKGIIGTGNNTIDSRVFMVDAAAREMKNQENLDVNEIAIKLTSANLIDESRSYLQSILENNQDITIQTADEAVPGSSADITKTFKLLGNLVGVIALIVGAITIFIVIFVNAITRRKYIGILKGIGISAQAIEISYVIQSLFYALSGVLVASLFLMGFLKPYLDIHPLVLPIAEGKLAVTTNDILTRGIILIVTSLISGFIPARLVTRQNTLDSILGK